LGLKDREILGNLLEVDVFRYHKAQLILKELPTNYPSSWVWLWVIKPWSL